ncbi:MAG: OB-fold nucleic acid binding domain-containing protein [Actinomycetales bacterium]|nr:OB-fold nucleic acid binding domain-containing protein [Actinomycetales bacterium]
MTWREKLDELFASQAEIEAVDEREEALRRGTGPVEGCSPRRRALVSGVLRSVTYRPAETAPALVAELYDGSGSLDLIWLGRRTIAGIEPGRRIVVEGMVCEADVGRSHRVMYNPSYRLLAPAAPR